MIKILRYLKSVLGPDPLRADWNPSKALRLLLRNKNRKIGDALLDQSIIAGIGNILRNEILFRARLHPDLKVGAIPISKLRELTDIAYKLSRTFYEYRLANKRIKPLLLVYGRSGKPCIVCGTRIRMYYQKPNNRRTYYCPKCQKYYIK